MSSFNPYTSTYHYYPKNPANPTGWGISNSTGVVGLSLNPIPNSDAVTAFFAPEAISENHIVPKATLSSDAISSTLPLFVKVDNLESIPGRSINPSPFTTGTLVYYSVSLQDLGTSKNWLITFWNLYVRKNNPSSYNFNLYITRRTDSSTAVFSDGASINSNDLNALSKQAVFVAEEADQHYIFEETADLSSKLNTSGGTITGNLQVNGTTTLSGQLTANAGISLNNSRITNLATPVSNSDGATKQYVDNVVGSGTTPTILSDSITSTHLSKVAGSEAVSTNTIQDLAVTTSKLADLSVSSEKLIDSSITRNKIETNIDLNNKLIGSSIFNNASTPLGEFNNTFNSRRPVTSNTIRTGAITTEKLANSAITEITIADNAVTSNKILNSSITNDKILNSTITSTKLNTGSTFTFDSNGNFNIKKLTIGLNPSNKEIILDGSSSSFPVLKIPSPKNISISNTWNELLSVDPNLSGNGFTLRFYPQYKEVPGGNPNFQLDGDKIGRAHV